MTEGVLARRGLKAELSAFDTVALTPELLLEYGALARAGDRLYVATTYGAVPPARTTRPAAV